MSELREALAEIATHAQLGPVATVDDYDDEGQALLRRRAERVVDALLPVVLADREELERRAEDAEAEAYNLAADLDRCEERLWRLAALTGHVPSESDNNATAELVVTDALADREEHVRRALALADEWEERGREAEAYINRAHHTEIHEVMAEAHWFPARAAELRAALSPVPAEQEEER